MSREDVCRVFRHNLQLLTQHFHGVALMLIRAGNRGGPLCLLTSSPEKPPPCRSLCTAGSSSSACLFVRRHCERCGVYPGWGWQGQPAGFFLSPFSVYCKGCRNRCGRYFRRQTVWFELVAVVKWAALVICLQKWKQLSRLQRSLILFLLVLMLILGLISFPSITEQWRGNTLCYQKVCYQF